MKILFWVPRLDSPSTRWRVLQLVPHFERAGVNCAVEEIPGHVLGKLAAAKRALDYDVVVVQKRLLPRLVTARLRNCARRLIFEFDDNVMLKKGGEGVRSSPTRERRFRRIVRAADAIITTNELLAEQARRHAEDPARVAVLPSAIDLDRWPARAVPRREGVPVIGWAGTAGMLPQLEVIGVPLARLARRHEGLKLRVVCEEGIRIEGVEIEHRPFSLDREVEDVQSFDVAVAPQVEDAWTRGKVSAKILAYFAAGVPTVASDIASHRIYLKDGENGLLAGTLTAWEEKLERLITSAELRERLGGAGRAAAEREFSVGAVVPRYLELFERLSRA